MLGNYITCFMFDTIFICNDDNKWVLHAGFKPTEAKKPKMKIFSILFIVLYNNQRDSND